MANTTALEIIDRGPMIRGVNIFLMSLSGVAVIIRFVSRKLAKSGFWWDDWLCLAALPVVIVMNVLPIIATYHGLGKHFEFAAWDAFEYVQLLFFLDLLLGPLAITLVKASVIFFYRRTFRTASRRFPIFTWVLFGVLIAWFFAMFIVTIFTCKPIAAQWNPLVHGECLDAHKFFLGQAASNVIIDFVLLLTPVPFLLRLHVSTSKKIGLLVIFAMGYFVPVIAIMRLITANDIFDLAVRHEFDPTVKLDLTWNYVDAEVWTFAEPAAGIISCSLPASSYLFRRVLMQMGIGSTRKSTARPRRSRRHSHYVTHSLRPVRRVSIDGDFTRLGDDIGSPRNAYPKSDTMVSGGRPIEHLPRPDSGEPLGQIRITDEVDLSYQAARSRFSDF